MKSAEPKSWTLASNIVAALPSLAGLHGGWGSPETYHRLQNIVHAKQKLLPYTGQILGGVTGIAAVKGDILRQVQHLAATAIVQAANDAAAKSLAKTAASDALTKSVYHAVNDANYKNQAILQGYGYHSPYGHSQYYAGSEVKPNVATSVSQTAQKKHQTGPSLFPQLKQFAAAQLAQFSAPLLNFANPNPSYNDQQNTIGSTSGITNIKSAFPPQYSTLKYTSPSGINKPTNYNNFGSLNSPANTYEQQAQAYQQAQAFQQGHSGNSHHEGDSLCLFAIRYLFIDACLKSFFAIIFPAIIYDLL